MVGKFRLQESARKRIEGGSLCIIEEIPVSRPSNPPQKYGCFCDVLWWN